MRRLMSLLKFLLQRFPIGNIFFTLMRSSSLHTLIPMLGSSTKRQNHILTTLIVILLLKLKASFKLSFPIQVNFEINPTKKFKQLIDLAIFSNPKFPMPRLSPFSILQTMQAFTQSVHEIRIINVRGFLMRLPKTLTTRYINRTNSSGKLEF